MPATRPAVAAPRSPARHYTLAEANRSLPLVRRIAADVAAAHAAARGLQTRLEVKLPPAERSEVEADLRRAVDRLEMLAGEVSTLGCDLSDYARGRVDFPARHDGRPVRLRWTLGDDRVAHWFDPAAPDPAARRPQPVEALDEGIPL